MAANCRFAFAVHVLAALAWRARRGFECGITSEDLAGSVNTNPVVIRRLLGPLRAAGLIETVKGCGGGARLARPAEEITLCEVYRAVHSDTGLAAHPQRPNLRCPVGRHVELVLEEVFASAQKGLEHALEARTIAQVAAGIDEEIAIGAGPARPSTPH